MKHYTHPDALVSCEWVQQNLKNPGIRIIESNEDILLYNTGHIPGAVKIDWTSDLQDQTVRDYIDPRRFEGLCTRLGIGNNTTVVFYGDKKNWWACYALWVFRLFGHESVKIMNGGRKKWQEEGLPLVKEIVSYPQAEYRVSTVHRGIRALREDIFEHLKSRRPLVDVRSPGEYTGELLHMPDYPQEGALRGGHIPGAVNVPWARTANDDGTFKSREDIEKIYIEEQRLKPSDNVIVYCRIGERSSHTWFVLTYLLGFKNVRNYDGSWTEWGNLVGVPIEKGASDKPIDFGQFRTLAEATH